MIKHGKDHYFKVGRFRVGFCSTWWTSTNHGWQSKPETWAWFRLFACTWIKLGANKPSWGRRIWLYTRVGACIPFEIYKDNRNEQG